MSLFHINALNGPHSALRLVKIAVRADRNEYVCKLTLGPQNEMQEESDFTRLATLPM